MVASIWTLPSYLPLQLGFCTFYHKFIPGFSDIVSLLTTLTCKGKPWTWGSAQQNAFDTLLTRFQTTLVLHLPDIQCPFIVMTDASLLASGRWGSHAKGQQQRSPPLCIPLPNLHLSRTELQYLQSGTAHCYPCPDHWRHYLQGTEHPVTLLTNHKNLTNFHQPQKLSHCQACWMMFLQDFDLHFVHTPRTAMGPADALSHLINPDTSSDNMNITLLPDDLFIHIVDTTLVDKITSSSTSDPLVLDTLKHLSFGSPLLPCSSVTDWHFSDSCLYFKHCLYVPPDARHDLVASIHSSLASGHGGFFHTYSLLSHDYWWPGMTSFVCCFVSGCTLCQQMKVNTHPSVSTLSPLLSSCSHPFQQLSIDLVTDLPLSNGYDSLLVVVNHSLSKGVILTPCNKTIDAKGVTELFFKNVFLQFTP